MCAFVWTPTCLPPLSSNRYTQTCLPSPSHLPLFLFVDTLYFQGHTADESLATSWGPDKPLVCLDVEELSCNRLLFKCCLIQWWHEGGLGVELNCTQVYMYGTVRVITFVFWDTVHWRCSIKMKQCLLVYCLLCVHACVHVCSCILPPSPLPASLHPVFLTPCNFKG